jgi:hypothetical protein
LKGHGQQQTNSSSPLKKKDLAPKGERTTTRFPEKAGYARSQPRASSPLKFTQITRPCTSVTTSIRGTGITIGRCGSCGYRREPF